MAKTLQGGHFDTADRLFKAIHSSWLSSSEENLQDVRELIPEFYFLPDFLKNSNKFEFGETQKGEVVDDVVLPPWAGGDPIEFIRKHREALESKYVSEHIHLWIDLIFGYRQRGPAAKSALNLFMPLTYGGEVDIDSITDPMLRAATISQINNFGQTPGRLFHKPHPKRHVPDVIKTNPTQDGVTYSIDAAGVMWHEKMTPPLNIVGKSPLLWVSRIACTSVVYPNNLKSGSPVGDVRLAGKDRLVAVPKGCILLPPRFNKFIRYGKSGGGISIHPVHSPTARTAVISNLDSTAKEISIYEQLHPRMISCVAVTKEGDLVVTGGVDRSVRVWELQSKKLEHHASFIGHSGAIIALDICASFSLVVSGSEDRTAMVWDCSSQPKLLHVLDNHKGPVVSVSINPICGSITTLTTYELRLYNVNGVLLASVNFLDAISRMNNAKPTFKLMGKVVLAPPCGEWQHDAVVAVTGHTTGHVLLWKLACSTLDDDVKSGNMARVQRELVPFVLSQTHSAPISTLRLCPSVVTKSNSFILKPFDGENNYELLVGDTDGYVSRWAPAKLDHMSPTELQDAVESGKLKNVK
jgi:WD40 repeat protein